MQPDPAQHQRVLKALRDNPHDDTVDGIARRTRLAASEVQIALRALIAEHLVIEASGHWQLNRRGWRAARELGDGCSGAAR
jgi:DNA-binding IclR family transcriptional regulator